MTEHAASPSGFSVRKFLIYSVVLIALVSTPFFFSLVREKINVDRSFEHYASALKAGDYKAAYAFTSETFRRQTSYDAFVAQHQEAIGQYGKLTELKRTQELVSNEGIPLRWKARILSVHQYQKGELQIVYEWRKEGEGWRIFGYKVDL